MATEPRGVSIRVPRVKQVTSTVTIASERFSFAMPVNGLDVVPVAGTLLEIKANEDDVIAVAEPAYGGGVLHVSGVDDAGAPALYDIPDEELSKYKLNLKPITDEVRYCLFPGKDK